MSRNKKIVIAVVVVLVLGAIAFANFKFKRTEGLEVTTEPVKKRHLEAIVSASGKIQPKRDVNISADTMGRVTDLAVDEGHRVTKGQFLLQIDPRNLRTAVQRTEASVAAGRSQVEQLKTSIESSKVALKQAQDNYTRQQNLWKGGLTTRETLERTESDLRLREADLRAQEQSLRTQQLRVESESATAARRPVRSQQGADRVADHRHRDPPQYRGRGNRRHRDHEQRRHGAADNCRHVGHPGGSGGR